MSLGVHPPIPVGVARPHERDLVALLALSPNGVSSESLWCLGTVQNNYVPILPKLSLKVAADHRRKVHRRTPDSTVATPNG